MRSANNKGVVVGERPTLEREKGEGGERATRSLAYKSTAGNMRPKQLKPHFEQSLLSRRTPEDLGAKSVIPEQARLTVVHTSESRSSDIDS